MKKSFIRFFGLLSAVIIAFSVCAFEATAVTATAVIAPSPNKSSYSVGETVTVSCTMTVDKELYSYNSSLEYNGEVVQYVSGGTHSGSTVKWADGLSGEKKFTVSATFKAIAAGSCYFKFNGSCSDGDVNFDKSSGWTMTVAAAAQKSTNANLSALSVNPGTMTPKFSANTTTYAVTVPFATTSVTIGATKQDSKATLTGVGVASNLAVGKTVRTIVVTAESGAKKTYTINITRLAEGATSSATSSTTSDTSSSTVSSTTSDTSSDTTSSTAEPVVTDPLLVTATDGSKRIIVSDIGGYQVPEGFIAATEMKGNVSVGKFVEADGKTNYTLYVTTSESGEDASYYYNTAAGYKRLAYMIVNNNMYIIENPPETQETPDGYYESTMSVNGTIANVYKFEEKLMADFYVLYCYTNGEYGYYRFDSYETSIQRAPDFTAAKQDAAISENVSSDTSIIGNLSLRYKSMSALGKAVVIGIGLCILAIIITVIILIVKLVTDREDDDFGGDVFGKNNSYAYGYDNEMMTDDGILDYETSGNETSDTFEFEFPSDSDEIISETETAVEATEQTDTAEAEAPEKSEKTEQTAEETDDDDDDFDEESLKNLRGF